MGRDIGSSRSPSSRRHIASSEHVYGGRGGVEGGIKLNESGRLNEARRPSERQNSWQQAKHTGLYLGDTL